MIVFLLSLQRMDNKETIKVFVEWADKNFRARTFDGVGFFFAG